MRDESWRISKERYKKVFDSSPFLMTRADLVLQGLLLVAEIEEVIERFPEL